MLATTYRRRLERDLGRWRSEGWVDADGAARILASLGDGRPVIGLASLLGLLGGILVGLGAIAFVAANWEAIPRLVRLVLIVAGLAAAYGAAAALSRRRHDAAAEAAMVAGGLFFAAAIALVGQTYHLAGAFADAILLWCAGMLVAAAATRSPAATSLALVGGAYLGWLGLAGSWQGGPDLPSLAVILAGLAIATALADPRARRLGVLLVMAWLAVALVQTADRRGWSGIEVLGFGGVVPFLLLAAGAALTHDRVRRVAALGHDVLLPALVASLLVVGAVQLGLDGTERSGAAEWLPACLGALALNAAAAALAWRRGGFAPHDAALCLAFAASPLAVALLDPGDGFLPRLLAGILALGAALWAVWLGQSGRIAGAKRIGLAAFGLEIFYLYAVTLGTLLDTAVAFLLGGVLFIVLSVVLLRLERRLRSRRAAVPS